MTAAGITLAVGIRPEALGLWRELEARLAALDRPTPCAVRPGLFADDARYLEAEDACWDCPVMALCELYADAQREPTGVWGGRLRGPRPRGQEAAA